MNKKIIFIFFVLIVIPFVVAQISFYSGGIYADSLNARIDVQNKASISLDYLLVNKNSEEEKVDITFIGIPEDTSILLNNNEFKNEEIIFEPNEKKTIHITYVQDIQSSDNLNILNFEPDILLDGMHNSEKIHSYNVNLILPEKIKSIISSNKGYDSKTTEEGRIVHYWTKENVYPTSLTVMWSGLDVNLAVKQEADTNLIIDVNQIITVTITIENKGGKEVKDISLSTYFIPTDFEAVEPLKEFEQPSATNDFMLIWNKKIGSLKSKETKTLQYSIRPKSLITDFSIKPITVRIDNSLVGVSNQINIITKQADTCGDKTCQDEENYANCPQDCPPGGADGYCDEISDDRCDPDCTGDTDPDCVGKKVEKEGVGLLTWLLLIIIFLALVCVGGLLYLYLYAKKKGYKLSGIIKIKGKKKEEKPKPSVSIPRTLLPKPPTIQKPSPAKQPTKPVVIKPERKTIIQLKAFVNSLLKKGYTKLQIRQAATKAGWTKAQIDQALKSKKSKYTIFK